MTTIGASLKKIPASFEYRDAVILLAHVLRKPKEFILAHPEKKVSALESIRFARMVRRFERGWPLAHLTHTQEFFRLEFFVNRHALVPRPDTELLVEEALEEIKKYGDQAVTLIDVGTGSGCIPISILKSLDHPIKTYALDISASALRVAKKNAEHHHVAMTFLRGNLLEPLDRSVFSLSTPIVITANLPYGWKEWKNSSSIESRRLNFEPAVALFTGEHGLELYRKFFIELAELNRTLTAFIEFDPRQTEELTELVNVILPAAAIEIKKDLAGRDRLAIIRVS